jgi:hypothetical protein
LGTFLPAKRNHTWLSCCFHARTDRHSYGWLTLGRKIHILLEKTHQNVHLFEQKGKKEFIIQVLLARRVIGFASLINACTCIGENSSFEWQIVD